MSGGEAGVYIFSLMQPVMLLIIQMDIPLTVLVISFWTLAPNAINLNLALLETGPKKQPKRGSL